MLSRPFSFPRGHFLRLALVAALLPLLGGCGSSSKLGTVTGKVTIDGQPPASGTTVIFIGPDNKSQMAAPVESDGTYRALEVPLGLNKIAVKGMAGTAVGGKLPDLPGMTPVAKGVPVPKKYENPDNGQQFEVKPGNQEHNLDLKK